ncbi:MAG: hypothetical protein LBH00_04635 [Planctomycetaceae bacterium]|jgi:siroheme synthase|nr:hypothetical protein [Planctomycetaceae bacterium]
MMSTFGKVYFVGAGPGDPDLLTVRAVQCLESADVVVYGCRIHTQTLSFARNDAELIPLTPPYESAARILAAHAATGKTVVRLMEGDPSVFGHLHGEIGELCRQKIPFDIVPGVTMISGAVRAAGVSLTRMDRSRAVAFVICSFVYEKGLDAAEFDFERLGSFFGTVVLYGGITNAEHWSYAMIKGGMAYSTPVLIVRRSDSPAVLPERKIVRTTLSEIKHAAEENEADDSCIVIIGKVTDYGETAEGLLFDENEESEWLDRR